MAAHVCHIALASSYTVRVCGKERANCRSALGLYPAQKAECLGAALTVATSCSNERLLRLVAVHTAALRGRQKLPLADRRGL